MQDKITCMIHKVHFEDGVCPECEIIKQTVSITYKSNKPIHVSDYMLNLDIQTERIKNLTDKLNKKLEKLLEANKPKETE